MAAISQVRKIDTVEELDAMQCLADEILRETLECYDDGAIEESDLAAYVQSCRVQTQPEIPDMVLKHINLN